MTDSNELTRRAFVRALGGLAGGILLAACAPAATPVPTSSAGPEASPPAPSPTPNATATAPASPSPAVPPPTAASLPLRQRIARLLVVGFRGLTVDDAPWIRTAIAQDGLGGVILFDRDQATGGSRNVHDPAQVRTLVSDLRALAPDRTLIVGIDQEGGLVTRLSPKWGYPAVASEADIGRQGSTAIKSWAATIATTLADAGVNLNFAPVVDLNVNPTNPAIGALDRAFSDRATVVADDAAIELRAHRMAGVRTAIKHFPGLGSASANTDFGVADVTKTWTPRELDPYRSLLAAGLVDAIMVGHLVNGQLDPDAPASLSHDTVAGALRRDLGFDGVVVTDDMGAAAIVETFGFEDAIALALEAGEDLVLFANQQAYDPALIGKVVDVIEGLVRSGRITEARIDQSIARVEALFGRP